MANDPSALLDQLQTYANGRPVHLDRAGEHITLRRWAEGMEDPAYRVIAEDKGEGWRVLTLWQGIDNYPLDVERALIFGTAVWRNEVFTAEFESATEDEARAAHVEALAKIGRGEL